MNRALILPALLWFASPLIAAERVALVIGNDAYQHAEKLNTAVGDATAVAQSLSGLGFDVISVMNTGVETLLESFEKLSARAQGATAVVVYFAGHGIEAGGVNYLIPVDAKLDREVQLRTQTVSLDTVLDELKQMNVPARMVILDCCRNNPLQGRAWRATRSSGGGLAALAQDTLSEATLVVFSASPGKPALDRVADADTHSPFASALLDQLPKPGVHSFEMFGHVEDAVIQKTDGRQAPRLFYNGSTQPFRTFRFGPTETTTASVHSAPTAPTMPVQSSPPATPPAPTPSAVELPASGFFDLDALFQPGPYAAYNSHSRSQILKQAQQKLKAAGLYDSTADGIMGRGSQKAIVQWQQQRGMAVTGRMNKDTLASMGLDAIGESQPAPPPVRKPAAEKTAPPSSSPASPTPALPSLYPTAARIPGKRGFVKSPFTQTVIDVRDIPSGYKARCPETGRVFYVP